MCDCVFMYVCVCLSVCLRSWGSPVLCNFLSAPHPSLLVFSPPFYVVYSGNSLSHVLTSLRKLWRSHWIILHSFRWTSWPRSRRCTKSCPMTGLKRLGAVSRTERVLVVSQERATGFESTVVRASKTRSSLMILGPGVLKISLKFLLILSPASSILFV